MICGRCSRFSTRFVEFMKGHWQACVPARWQKVFDARAEGNGQLATRRAKAILGIKGKEMSEEDRERTRTYREEHKEEIAFRQKVKRQERRALKATLKQRGQAIKRKR